MDETGLIKVNLFRSGRGAIDYNDSKERRKIMRKPQNFQWNEISLGTCYYPEHWDKSLWEEDLERMKAVGIRTIRIGEFAWSKVEPREGEFTYEFFDGFLEVACKAGMKVIFGTPTATPPAWLTEKYPEVLNCRMDGVKFRHGMRRHYNYNSPVYQRLSARIVEKFAGHYASHPSVIGWQIDNEINCEVDVFYSESDTLAFREYLKKKYATLDNLNKELGMIFWNQEYTDWEEVYVPRTTIHDSANPHLTLEYYRFISESAAGFCKMQSDIIRKYKKPGDFITTNGMFGHLDNHRMMDDALDVYTYDSYPNFAYCLEEDPLHSKSLNDRKWSNHLSRVRSICPHFGIMEQQSGANGWNTRMEAPAPKPGQMLLWAMQSIAHGADYVSFFRWRTCTVGTEIYWHGILDYDNRDNRKLREVAEISRLAASVGKLAGAEYRAGFGVLEDYDNLWDADVDVWHRRLEKASKKEIFAASQLSHTPMDYVLLSDNTEYDELKKYPVLFYPHGLILTEEREALLKTYVEKGGCLVIGARTGQKEEHGRCVMAPMPGLLSELTGTAVEEFTFVGALDGTVCMEWQKEQLDTGIFNDVLETVREDVEVLARYTSSYYAGKPALTQRKAGEGKVLHFGGTFTRETVEAMLRYLGVLSPYAGEIELPGECELCVREKEGNRYFIILNYSADEQKVVLKREMTDLDSGEKVSGTIQVKGYGVVVLR